MEGDEEKREQVIASKCPENETRRRQSERNTRTLRRSQSRAEQRDGVSERQKEKRRDTEIQTVSPGCSSSSSSSSSRSKVADMRLITAAKNTYTESAPDRRRVALLRLVLPPDPADAHGSQDDARHTQAHLHQGQQEQAPQDLAAGAHPAPGISPAPTGGGGQGAREESVTRSVLSTPLSAPDRTLNVLTTPSDSVGHRRSKVKLLPDLLPSDTASNVVTRLLCADLCLTGNVGASQNSGGFGDL
ncbi:hypothetical protein INR49_023588 [Caranx melampygus]|nr:hypothetical protein INR49_023588 [Caranx melampygus]